MTAWAACEQRMMASASTAAVRTCLCCLARRRRAGPRPSCPAVGGQSSGPLAALGSCPAERAEGDRVPLFGDRGDAVLPGAAAGPRQYVGRSRLEGLLEDTALVTAAALKPQQAGR